MNRSNTVLSDFVPTWAAAIRFVLCLVFCGGFFGTVDAQQSNVDKPSVTESETVAAERFFEVLLRRPRPGVALNKVYFFHVANRSLDSFLQRMDQAPPGEHAGEKQMIRGLIQMRRGQYGEAIRSLEKAEKWIPNNPMTSYQLARACIAVGETSQAIAALKRSIEKEPSRVDAPSIYLELARQLIRSKDTDEALVIWNQLGERFPGDRMVMERIANAMRSEKLFVPALDRYQELIKSTEDLQARVRFQIEVAGIQHEMGQVEQAARGLDSILLRLRPGSWLYSNVRNRLERCFTDGDDFTALANFYRQKFLQRPSDKELGIRFAEVLTLIKQHDEAEDILRGILERSREDKAAHQAMIDLLIQSGRRRETAIHYQKLVALDPSDPDILMRWGNTVLNDPQLPADERRREAAAIWRRILRIRPDDPISYVRVARLLESVDSQENTIATYRKAIELAPDKAEYREYLGQYLYGHGRRQEAVEVWESIAAPPRRNRDALVRLAEVFQTHQIFNRSVAAWRRASHYDLTFDQRVRYASALSEAGSSTQAIEQLETAQSLADSQEEHRRIESMLVDFHLRANTLNEAIEKIRSQPKTHDRLRFLAVLYLADSNLVRAWKAIEEARALAPTNREVLQVAAEIAQQQKRNKVAVELLRSLADLDPRFRAKHLRELLTLYQRMKHYEDAYHVAQELVKATPQSAESYRILAGTAAKIGREKEVGAALRVAVEFEPRSVSHRLALASHLAKTFHTDEAIDHYWQAMEHEKNWASRKLLITKMLPLYERRGDADRLLDRLQAFAFQSTDETETTCLIAAYWQSLGFHRRASTVMKQVVDQHPNSPGMIRQFVECLSDSGQLRAAAESQVHLVNLTGNTADIQRLTQLRIKLEESIARDRMKQKIRQSGKPDEMLAIIQQVAADDASLAIELCQIAIKVAPDAWGIQSVLAQLLLFQSQKLSRATLRETKAIAMQVVHAKHDSDDRPPSFGKHRKASSDGDVGSTVSRRDRSELKYRIRLFNSRTPRAGTASATYVISKIDFAKFLGGVFEVAQSPGTRATKPRNRYKRYVVPEDYRQAKWVCCAVAVQAQCQLNQHQQDPPSVDEVIDQVIPVKSSQITRERDELEEKYALHQFRVAMSGVTKPMPESLLWSMARAMPEGDIDSWQELIKSRLERLAVSEVAPPIGLSPLSDGQLTTLVHVFTTRELQGTEWSVDARLVKERLQLLQSVFLEHQFAKVPLPIIEIGTEQRSEKTLLLAIVEIQIALWRNDRSTADRLVADLTTIARRDHSPILVELLEASRHLTWLFAPKRRIERKFQSHHRFTLVDTWVAHCAARSEYRLQNASAKERIDFYAGGLTSPKSIQTKESRIPTLCWPKSTTISKHLLGEYLLSGFFRFPVTPYPSRAMVSAEMITHLENHPSNATAWEQKIRKLLVAYGMLWNGHPDICGDRLLEYSKSDPDDLDYQIELAAFDMRSGQIDQAINRLNNAMGEGKNSAALIGLVKTHLMRSTGAYSLVNRSAQQSLAQIKAGDFRSALAEHYRKMGVTGASVIRSNLATTRMQPILGGTQSSAPKQLRYASDALSTGNKILASEIAHAVAQQNLPFDGGDHAVYRRAIKILRRGGALKNLVESVESKLKEDRTDMAVQAELVSLYQLSGQHGKAAEIWKQESKTIPTDRLIHHASELSNQHEYSHAAVIYLIAFQRQPEYWADHWSEFVETCEAADNASLVFDHLAQQSLKDFSLFSLCNVMQITSADRFSREQRAFVKNLVENHPDAIRKQSLIERLAPTEEHPWIREQIAARNSK